MEEFWARHLDQHGNIGPAYWTYFAERLAAQMDYPVDAAILDLGTYDGNVLYKATGLADGNWLGVGADVYAGGFPDGITEAEQHGWQDRVNFVQANAERLCFPSDTFDCVISNFVGWDNWFDFKKFEFKSKESILSEIARIIRPGGQLGLGSWIVQSDLDWMITAFDTYVPPKDPANDQKLICYAVENQAGLRILLEQAGFEHIQFNTECDHFVSPDKETWWKQMERAVQLHFQRIDEPSELINFKRKVFKGLEDYERVEGICFTKTVIYSFGTKPRA